MYIWVISTAMAWSKLRWTFKSAFGDLVPISKVPFPAARSSCCAGPWGRAVCAKDELSLELICVYVYVHFKA